MSDPEHDRLEERLRKLLQEDPATESMAKALLQSETTWAHEILDFYLVLSEEDKADHLAFCDSGGPKKCHDLRMRHEDGTPTSVDLEEWAKGDGK